jgi:hypothetical protein
MASPRACRINDGDDEPRHRKGSPKLLGEKLDHIIEYRHVAELRSATLSPTFVRDMIIVLACKAGISQKAVGRTYGLSQPRVANILRKMETVAWSNSST